MLTAFSHIRRALIIGFVIFSAAISIVLFRKKHTHYPRLPNGDFPLILQALQVGHNIEYEIISRYSKPIIMNGGGWVTEAISFTSGNGELPLYSRRGGSRLPLLYFETITLDPPGLKERPLTYRGNIEITDPTLYGKFGNGLLELNVTIKTDSENIRSQTLECSFSWDLTKETDSTDKPTGD